MGDGGCQNCFQVLGIPLTPHVRREPKDSRSQLSPWTRVESAQSTLIASESYRRKMQGLVLRDLSFIVLQFGSCEWRLFVQHSFRMELRNGLRDLTAFAER